MSTLTEYWPGFVNRSDQPRIEQIASPQDALHCQWIVEKARKLGESPRIENNHYVMAGRFVIGLIK